MIVNISFAFWEVSCYLPANKSFMQSMWCKSSFLYWTGWNLPRYAFIIMIQLDWGVMILLLGFIMTSITTIRLPIITSWSSLTDSKRGHCCTCVSTAGISMNTLPCLMFKFSRRSVSGAKNLPFKWGAGSERHQVQLFGFTEPPWGGGQQCSRENGCCLIRPIHASTSRL